MNYDSDKDYIENSDIIDSININNINSTIMRFVFILSIIIPTSNTMHTDESLALNAYNHTKHVPVNSNIHKGLKKNSTAKISEKDTRSIE